MASEHGLSSDHPSGPTASYFSAVGGRTRTAAGLIEGANELSDELLPKGAADSKLKSHVAHAVSVHLQHNNAETAPIHVRRLNWMWVLDSNYVAKHVQLHVQLQ